MALELRNRVRDFMHDEMERGSSRVDMAAAAVYAVASVSGWIVQMATAQNRGEDPEAWIAKFAKLTRQYLVSHAEHKAAKEAAK